MIFSMTHLAQEAKQAATQIASLSSEHKNKTLLDMSARLRADTQLILQANRQDIKFAEENNLSEAMIDRLMLNKQRIEDIAVAIEQISIQDDPVGKTKHSYQLDNGLEVKKVSIPLGVIAMIYESRPNVTADAAALCFKAGNSVILRGGKEAIHSNIAIGNALHGALKLNGIATAAIGIVTDPDRKHMAELLNLNNLVDLIIPRGGESLIRYVSENSRIPVIQHYKGVCHCYIDKDADIDQAMDILVNGKVQRPGVCNALETLLIHKEIVEQFIPRIVETLELHKVKVHACKETLSYFTDAQLATDKDYHAEYLNLEIAVKSVDNLIEAVEHIRHYGSNHTEVIVTQNQQSADFFVQQTDSSVVMVNASSRFSDGGQLGLGAEIGISTSKLHAYGPMGADALTTERFVVVGEGQIRS